MAEVPNAKEFAALYRRMEVSTRRRLERLARRGQLASNPQEAALVAVFAQRGLRQIRWVVVLTGLLLALNVLSALVVESGARWLYLTVVVLAAIAIPVLLLWHQPRFLRAQLRNRKLVNERGAGETSSGD